MTRLEPARIAEIRERCEAATEGPWKHYYAKALRPGLGGGPVNEVSGADGKPVVFWTGFDRGNRSNKQVKQDAAFIAHAREDVPALLSHATAQAERIAELEGERLRLRDALLPFADAWRNGMRLHGKHSACMYLSDENFQHAMEAIDAD